MVKFLVLTFAGIIVLILIKGGATGRGAKLIGNVTGDLTYFVSALIEG